MRKLIAGLLAGLTLGAAGTAGATTAYGYWTEGGPSYTCTGVPSGVTCKERSGYGLYQVWITKGFVAINRGKQSVYGCPRGFGSSYDCFDAR
jgi:hypothetical protein